MASNPAVVRVESLTYKYAGHRDAALSDVSFEVREGEFVCVAGPSGCGKSTLALAIAGFIPHAFPGEMQGKVFIHGQDTLTLSPGGLSGSVGLVQQDPEGQLCTLKVVDEVAFGPENMRLPPKEIGERVDWALEAVRASHLADRSVYTLSGGEKQRVAIASVLAMRPSVFILDEPTANLDPEGTAQVLSVIHGLRKSRKMAVIVIEHRLRRVLPLANRLVFMDSGRILDAGAPAEVLSRHWSLAAPLRRTVPRAMAQRSKGAGAGSGTLGDALSGRQSGALSEALSGALSHAPSDSSDVLAEEPSGALSPDSEAPPAGVRPALAGGTASRPPLLAASGLTVAYEGKPVLQDVNLTFCQGEVVAIMGDNGSGKTSLLAAVIGLVKPSAGSIRLDGQDITGTRVASRAKSFGLSFQNPNHQLSESTVIDEVIVTRRNLVGSGVDSTSGSSPSGDSDFALAYGALERFGLADYMDENPFSLSLGEKKRVTIASAELHMPRVLLLDEPLVGQDPAKQVAVMEGLVEFAHRGGLVLMVCHEPPVARDWCDRLLFFEGGRLIVDGALPGAFDALAKVGKTHYLPDDFEPGSCDNEGNLFGNGAPGCEEAREATRREGGSHE